ncbi:cell division topological specificity factor MinE [Ectothiorhodospiraceae bacterium BW-2]|nr:cell division topological specificity factor MinE [Ectothiorhodospiraceae bacterium BW-2]
MPLPIFEAIFGSKQPPTSTARVAKERLQMVIAVERSSRHLDFMPQLKQEIIDVIKKYVKFDNDNDVQINMGRKENYEVLEVNVTLPDDPPAR